jgi:hypothetical protein
MTLMAHSKELATALNTIFGSGSACVPASLDLAIQALYPAKEGRTAML